MTRHPRQGRARPTSNRSDPVGPDDARPKPSGHHRPAPSTDATRLQDLDAVDAPGSTDDRPLPADLEALLWFG